MKYAVRSRISLPCLLGLVWLLVTAVLHPAQAQTTPAFNAAWATDTVASSLNSQSNITATARDAAGNVYVAGYFIGTAAFGSFSLSSTERYLPYSTGDAFVAQLDAQGDWLWTAQAGGAGYDFP